MVTSVLAISESLRLSDEAAVSGDACAAPGQTVNVPGVGLHTPRCQLRKRHEGPHSATYALIENDITLRWGNA